MLGEDPKEDTFNCRVPKKTNVGDVNSEERGSGARDNKGKVSFSIVPLHLLAGVARVLMGGQLKYAKWNWTKGMAWSVCYDCLMRHLFKWWFLGEARDDESGELHIDHAICNLLFLRHYYSTYKAGDDRPNNGVTRFSDNKFDFNLQFNEEEYLERMPYGGHADKLVKALLDGYAHINKIEATEGETGVTKDLRKRIEDADDSELIEMTKREFDDLLNQFYTEKPVPPPPPSSNCVPSEPPFFVPTPVDTKINGPERELARRKAVNELLTVQKCAQLTEAQKADLKKLKGQGY